MGIGRDMAVRVMDAGVDGGLIWKSLWELRFYPEDTEALTWLVSQTAPCKAVRRKECTRSQSLASSAFSLDATDINVNLSTALLVGLMEWFVRFTPATDLWMLKQP